GVLAAAEVERGAFLAVEAGDLARLHQQADARGRQRRGVLRIALLGDHERDRTALIFLHEVPAHRLGAERVAHALHRGIARAWPSLGVSGPPAADGMNTHGLAAIVPAKATTTGNFRDNMAVSLL